MINTIKPVLRWRGDHLFCGELCLASCCENGKGGFEVAHAQFPRAIATEIAEEEMERFFRISQSHQACQKKIRDVYSEILGMLDISITGGQLFFEILVDPSEGIRVGQRGSGLPCLRRNLSWKSQEDL